MNQTGDRTVLEDTVVPGKRAWRAAGMLLVTWLLGANLGCRPGAPESPLRDLARRFVADDPPAFFDPTALLDQMEVETWRLQRPEDLDAWQQRGFDRRFELARGQLFLQSTKRRPRLRREVDWQARSVDALVLEVPGFQRGHGRLYWAREGEELHEERSVTGRLVPGVVPLPLIFDVVFHPLWRGRIERIAIELYSPQNVEFRLLSVSAVDYRPVAERVADAAGKGWKIELDSEVRNGLLALPSATVTRTLTIPPEAVLRLGVATGAGARQPMIFSGHLDVEGGATTPLFETRVDPSQPPRAGRWHDQEIDLSAFAGVDATVRLETRAADGEHDLVHGFAFWSAPEVLRRSTSPRPNVVLISIDTLRADHLPSYGYGRQTAPLLEEWAARRAVVFDRAVATSPWTIPSHVSMFTGLDALRHGINHPLPIPARLEMLAELFRDAGYGTLAITGGGFMGPRRGFAQGFDRYRYWPDPKSEDELDDGVGRALDWIDDFDDRPFLLFFHTFEVHYPFRRREPHFTRLAGEQAAATPEIHLGVKNAPTVAEEGFLLRREFFWKPTKKQGARSLTTDVEVQEVVDRYDSGIAYTDERLARILTRLEQGGLDRRTVVVITSDHGEGLGEHGFAGHAYLYDWNLLVPLWIAAPGEPGGRRIDTQVRSIDLLPTLAEMADLEVPAGLDGASLVPLLEGRETMHPRAAWSYASFSNRGLSLRFDNRLKYLFNNTAWAPLAGREELYDLRRDPGEEHDLAVAGEDTDALREQARARLEQAIAGPEVRFTNASDRVYGGRIRGIAVHPTTVKTSGLPAGALTWSEIGVADFRVRPGDDFRLWLERADGQPLHFEGAFESSSAVGDAFKAVARVGDSETVWRLTHGAGGWADGAEAAPGPETGPDTGSETGIAISLRGGSPDAAYAQAIDSNLVEQLRALGYVD